MSRLPKVAGVAWLAAAIAVAAGACAGAPTAADPSMPKPVPTAYVTIVPITTTTTLPPVPTTPPPYGSISNEPQVHTIVAGDSFGKIAEQYGISIDAILLYNQFADSSQLLLPGATVGIPAGARVPGTGTGLVPPPGSNTDPNTSDPNADPSTSDVATGSSTTLAQGAGCTHTISANETPGGVASRYGITFDELQAANPDRDFTEWFLVTATINIPAGADC